MGLISFLYRHGSAAQSVDLLSGEGKICPLHHKEMSLEIYSERRKIKIQDRFRRILLGPGSPH